MRVLLCDDDRLLRSVLSSILGDLGHQVVAEADTVSAAIALLDRTQPDLAIVDLALRFSSGRDLVAAATEKECQTIVFTAFGNSTQRAGVVVDKPDFAKLERAVDAVAARLSMRPRRSLERRRRPGRVPSSAVPAPSIDSAEDFYRALGASLADDTLLRITVDEGAPDFVLADLVAAVRTVIRAQDHVTHIRDEVDALLLAGGNDGAAAVQVRLQRAWAVSRRNYRLRFGHGVVTADGLPADVLLRLRTGDPATAPTAELGSRAPLGGLLTGP
jgi:DNA-binding NarL/FixJ family response regulator